MSTSAGQTVPSRHGPRMGVGFLWPEVDARVKCRLSSLEPPNTKLDIQLHRMSKIDTNDHNDFE